ncbi:unnamed protein product [Clonostachys byssicola]|uniref:F-box domain-containing protein n=1 Tax=Clonostachys byssicola TaxID=160290 RepID=A0A9N9YA76_9HYPO|nr:unnamed protein product [Clonostachys byssicola]
MSSLIQPFNAAPITDGFASLPTEVLFTILEDDCLSLEDIASLRLMCRSFSEAAATILFRRIIISPLRQDRSAFENICRNPGLARHVREVEWSELAWFPDYFMRLISRREWLGFLAEEEYDTMLYNAVTLLDKVCVDTFWLPVVLRDREGARVPPLPPGRKELVNREEALKEFTPIFFELLGLLPHLHTMASRPMSSKRIIRSPEYSVRVGHIRAQTSEWPISKWNQSNDGLLLFILPALAHLPIPVRRLAWQDDLQGNGAFGGLRADAFRHLDTLSISLSSLSTDSFFLNTNKSARLEKCLEACTNVQHLSLSMESEHRPGREINYCPLTTSLLRYSPETKRSNWRELVSLNLNSMVIEDHTLFLVVRENAETLRHLYLHECNMTLGTLKKLSKIGLRLRSAQILSECQKICHIIPEQKLLEFLNHEKVPEGEGVQMCTYLDETLEEDTPDIPQSSYYEIHPHRMFDDDCPEVFTNTLVMTVPAADLLGYTSFDDDEFEPERLNNADIDASDQGVAERVRNGPKWLWNRCCGGGQIYFTQVSNSHPDGFPTVAWKFTNRNGISYIGNDPWEGFKDWDPDKGDVEEPLPYSAELDEAIEAANFVPTPHGVVLYDRLDAFRTGLFIDDDSD